MSNTDDREIVWDHDDDGHIIGCRWKMTPEEAAAFNAELDDLMDRVVRPALTQDMIDSAIAGHRAREAAR
jgi:hypothetical protein